MRKWAITTTLLAWHFLFMSPEAFLFTASPPYASQEACEAARVDVITYTAAVDPDQSDPAEHARMTVAEVERQVKAGAISPSPMGRAIRRTFGCRPSTPSVLPFGPQ